MGDVPPDLLPRVLPVRAEDGMRACLHLSDPERDRLLHTKHVCQALFCALCTVKRNKRTSEIGAIVAWALCF